MGADAPGIRQRNISDEWPDIKKLYGGQTNQYLRLTRRDPLLAAAYPFALNQLENVGDLTGPLSSRLSELLNIAPTLSETFSSQIAPVLTSGGALTPEQARDVTQATRAGFASRGNVMGNQALGSELLNRDQYRQQRFQTAIGQAGALEGLQGSDVSQRLGLTSGIQGLNTQALQNVLGTERTGVESFSRITNPILAYAQDLFSSNQNAAAAESVAGANKSGGAAGGALSAVGQIAGAVLPIIMASDKNLKENIRNTGKKTPEGIPIKTFRYRGDKRRFKGVIAQDVEKVKPSAVLTMPLTGHKLVDMSAIDAPFMEIPTLIPRKHLPKAKAV